MGIEFANRRTVATLRTALLLAAVAMVAATGVSPAAAAPHLEISCGEDAQDTFDRGLALLHSFEYPEATAVFGRMRADHPDCAMAWWGAAMSLWHPLWAPPSTEELEQGAAFLATASTLDAGDRERGWIEALGAFFSSTDRSTHGQRAAAWQEQMRLLHEADHGDVEAALFHALSLLATADPHDKSYAHQYRAAAILRWVQSSDPLHPGVLHYLIHSFDFPGLAYLALDAATTYADAAPDSAHAQHMPSHIFTRLGLWDRAIHSNVDSTRSAAAYTDRAGLPGHYDEGLHSIDYLVYALLQSARDDRAREVLEGLAAIERTSVDNFKVAYTYAAAPARVALERRQWQEAADLELIREDDFPWQDFAWARSIHHFARGIGAARSGNLEGARRELAVIERLQEEVPSTALPYWREEVDVQRDLVAAWILFAEGKGDRALELAAAAAEREDAVDKHPVTPGEVLPARELYADLLLALGRSDEAADQYAAVLRQSPNRLNALLGLARAAQAAGRGAEAEAALEQVRSQTAGGAPSPAERIALR